MIDRFIFPVQRRVLQPLAVMLARHVAADHLTIGGFVIGLLALPALTLGWFKLALVFILLNRLVDGLDGAVARIQGASDRGAFLDIALDFMFYAAIPFGFALADPAHNALSAAFLLMGFIGTGSSFLAFATIAAGRGLQAADYPTKGIYYLGGLTEGFETILFFVLITLFPTTFPWAASVFAVLCLVTTLTRWHQGWTAFNSPN